jgi:hypothetical protein
MNAWLSHVAPKVYLAYFIQARQWLDLFYLFALPPIMGLAAYAMKKWSYAIFVAGSSWMLYRNFLEAHHGAMPLFYAIALCLGNLGFVTYFLLPQVHAPYLNPKLRWWESKTRFIVDWPCRITETPEQSGTSCRIQDFSEGGVFLQTPEPVSMEQIVHIRISPSSNEILALKAKPVFSRPVQNGLGYGLQFVEIDKVTAKRLSHLARQLHKSGSPFRNEREDNWTAFKYWAKRLMTTGHGLLPEPDRAPVRPNVSSSENSQNAQAS